MATGTFKWYRKGLVTALSGSWDYTTDVIKVMLTTSAYTPDQDAHDYKNDISGYEVTGAGYTAGGAALAGKSIGASAGCIAKLIATDVEWTTSSIAARKAVVYASTTAASNTCPLIGYVELSATTTSSSGTWELDFNAASGFLRIDGA